MAHAVHLLIIKFQPSKLLCFSLFRIALIAADLRRIQTFDHAVRLIDKELLDRGLVRSDVVRKAISLYPFCAPPIPILHDAHRNSPFPTPTPTPAHTPTPTTQSSTTAASTTSTTQSTTSPPSPSPTTKTQSTPSNASTHSTTSTPATPSTVSKGIALASKSFTFPLYGQVPTSVSATSSSSSNASFPSPSFNTFSPSPPVDAQAQSQLSMLGLHDVTLKLLHPTCAYDETPTARLAQLHSLWTAWMAPPTHMASSATSATTATSSTPATPASSSVTSSSGAGASGSGLKPSMLALEPLQKQQLINALLRAFVTCGHAFDPAEILLQMKSCGAKPNQVSLNCLLCASFKLSDSHDRLP